MYILKKYVKVFWNIKYIISQIYLCQIRNNEHIWILRKESKYILVLYEEIAVFVWSLFPQPWVHRNREIIADLETRRVARMLRRKNFILTDASGRPDVHDILCLRINYNVLKWARSLTWQLQFA